MMGHTQTINLTFSPVQSITKIFLPDLVKNSGVDYSEFLHITGSSEASKTNDPIGYRQLAHLLSRAAELMECEHFGILLGQSGTTDSFGEFYFEALKAPTVREALNRLATQFRSKDCGAVLELATGKVACLRYIIVDPAIDSGAAISDLAIAIAMRMLVDLCGPGWRAELVELSRRKPGDCRPYSRHFKCPIVFNTAIAAIHFDGAWLDRPLAARRSHEPGTHPAPQESVDPAMTERVILQLSRSISTGSDVSASKIARLFGICDRTLQRELTKAQTSYRSLSAEVHFGVAKRLLQDTDMPVTDIALSLGYADVSVLTRAFTRWAGMCPSDWRSHRQPHSREPVAAPVADFTARRFAALQQMTA